MLTHLNWMAHQINHSLLILKRWGSLSAYLQEAGSKAKPYQVKQVRNIIVKYKLGGDE